MCGAPGVGLVGVIFLSFEFMQEVENGKDKAAEISAACIFELVDQAAIAASDSAFWVSCSFFWRLFIRS